MAKTVKRYTRELTSGGRRGRGSRLSPLRVSNEAYASLPHGLYKLWWTYGLQRKRFNVVIRKGFCPSSSESCLRYQLLCPSLFRCNHHMMQRIDNVCILLQSYHHLPPLSYRNRGILLQAYLRVTFRYLDIINKQFLVA